MSERWYCVSKWKSYIAPVAVAKSTGKTLLMESGSRVAIHSNYEDYFPTLTAAVQHVRRRTENSIAHCERELRKYHETLATLAAEYPEEYAAQTTAQEARP